MEWSTGIAETPNESTLPRLAGVIFADAGTQMGPDLTESSGDLGTRMLLTATRSKDATRNKGHRY